MEIPVYSTVTVSVDGRELEQVLELLKANDIDGLIHSELDRLLIGLNANNTAMALRLAKRTPERIYHLQISEDRAFLWLDLLQSADVDCQEIDSKLRRAINRQLARL
jgi:hypothetical protein